MSAVLERRYAVLLRAYPADVRRARGAEMLATLIEAAPQGRRSPELREAVPLVVGGLRERAGANARRSPRQVWLSALRMAVLILLGWATAQAAGGVAYSLAGNEAPMSVGDPDQFWMVVLGLQLAAFLATAGNRYRAGLLLSVLALLANQTFAAELAFQMIDYGELWPRVLAVVLAVPLLRWRPADPPAVLRWLLLLPVIAVVMPNQMRTFLDLHSYAFAGIAIVALAWAAVDIRVPIAFGLAWMPVLLSSVGLIAWGHIAGGGAVALELAQAAAPIVLLVGVGATVARRQLRDVL